MSLCTKHTEDHSVINVTLLTGIPGGTTELVAFCCEVVEEVPNNPVLVVVAAGAPNKGAVVAEVVVVVRFSGLLANIKPPDAVVGAPKREPITHSRLT